MIGRIQQRFNEIAPILNYGARPNLVAWQPNVHDAEYSYSGIMLFDKAWMAK